MAQGGVESKTNKQAKLYLTLTLNNLQHVWALKSHLQAEYKAVYVIQCHKMYQISCT